MHVSCGGPSGAHGGQALEGDHGETSHACHISGSTWFGDGDASMLIDYVWAHQALALRCSGPLRRLASEIQLINTRQLKDHVPLGLEFDLRAACGAACAGNERLGTLTP